MFKTMRCGISFDSKVLKTVLFDTVESIQESVMQFKRMWLGRTLYMDVFLN